MTAIDRTKDALHPSKESTSQDAPASLGVSGVPGQVSPVAEDKLPELPDQEVFDNKKVAVIFVLGGPGAGTSIPRPCTVST